MGLLLFFLISFLSFFQSTLSGGGAALLLLPLLSMILGAKMVAPVMTIGTSITGFSRLWIFREHIDWELVKWYAIPSAVAAFAGAYVLILVKAEWLQLVIGVFLILSIFQFLDKLKEKPKDIQKDMPENMLGTHAADPPKQVTEGKTMGKASFMGIGIFVAFLSGLIGGVGPLMNVFYLKYGLTKEKLIGTRTANETLIHLVKIVTYFALGDFPFLVVFTGVVIGVSGILGSILGKKLLSNLNNRTFVRMVLVTMVVSGAIMIWQSIDFLKEILGVVGGSIPFFR